MGTTSDGYRVHQADAMLTTSLSFPPESLMPKPASTPQTILITGASSGFGHAIAEAALAAGHRVVGTFRSESAGATFHDKAPGRSFGVLLDVRNTDSIASTVQNVERQLGHIDVLINNAGYGHEGTIEESSMVDLRNQFEVNFFGAVAVLQAVIPSMRTRRAGHIFNITSMGGFITMPGLGFYHASKFALEAISETLGKELEPLGVRVTAVAPGSFRTDWSGRSMVRAERTIPDYDAILDPIRKRRLDSIGKQPGDPKKAAEAILGMINHAEAPTHLLLGADAVDLVRDKLRAVEDDIRQWEKVSRATSF